MKTRAATPPLIRSRCSTPLARCPARPSPRHRDPGSADSARCSRRSSPHLHLHEEKAVSCGSSRRRGGVRDKESGRDHRQPARAWADVIDADGGHLDAPEQAGSPGAARCRFADYPCRTRLVVRRERTSALGAQLEAFGEVRRGWCYTAFATEIEFGQLAYLDARPARPRRGRIVAKRTPASTMSRRGHYVSARSSAINHAWLTMVVLAVDPPPRASTCSCSCAGDSRKPRRNTLCYRLSHVPAPIPRGQR